MAGGGSIWGKSSRDGYFIRLNLLADQGALEAGFRHGQLGIGEIAVAQLFPGPFL